MNITNIYEDILVRQLNISKLLKLPAEKSAIIINLFNDLMTSCSDGHTSLPGGLKMDIYRMVVLYNTLVDEGWLVTRRERNLEALTEEDDNDN